MVTHSLTHSLVSSTDDDVKTKWLVYASFSHTYLWTHQHPSNVCPACTLLSWLPLRSFLSANTDLSVCETREFSIPLSSPRTTNQILAEIIPWVPLGECKPIHVSKVAASLKVDNQSLCDANRQRSQQTLSPAAQALQLSCIAVKTLDYLGWIDHHRCWIITVQTGFTDLDRIPPPHQDCRDDHKTGRKSLSLKQQCFETTNYQFLCTVSQLFVTHSKSMFFNQYIHKIQTNQGRKEWKFIFFLNQSLQQVWNNCCFSSFWAKGEG